jgi:hypothetical protein
MHHLQHHIAICGMQGTEDLLLPTDGEGLHVAQVTEMFGKPVCGYVRSCIHSALS